MQRALTLLAAIGLALAGMVVRVAYLQTYGRQQTIRRADRQQHMVVPLRARPGEIFDRLGNLMAGTVQTQTLFADPAYLYQQYQTDDRHLDELEPDITSLARLIDRDPIEISQLLAEHADRRFVKLAENLDDNACKAIRKLDMPGIGLMPENQRYYPLGSVAAHVLGGVARDGTGLEGVELEFRKTLAGHDGVMRVVKDARRRGIAVAADDYQPPVHGQHIVLTIDTYIQMIAEQELARACSHYRAKGGEVVVMDPQTGDVLALANWPTFNPQMLQDSTPETRRDRCLTDPFEPGSTFKPFIVGPALEGHVVSLDHIWPIPGISYRTPLRPKPITDVHFYGPLSMWDVLVKSSNIGMTMLGERMGKSRIYRALSGFRFGRATGIELPGENPGHVDPLGKWSDYTVPSVCQGYAVMVTPLQLARGMCAYANGGRLVQPHLLRGILEPDGAIASRTPPTDLALLPQAVDPVTAAEVRRVLCDVVVRGTATSARSHIWNVFGKTGTAKVSAGVSGYAEGKYTASFIGGAPAENPRLVIAMVIHEPDRSLAYYGGTVSGPAAGRVLVRSLAYLQVPPSPDLPLPPPEIAKVLVNYNPKVYARPATRHPVLTAAE